MFLRALLTASTFFAPFYHLFGHLFGHLFFILFWQLVFSTCSVDVARFPSSLFNPDCPPAACLCVGRRLHRPYWRRPLLDVQPPVPAHGPLVSKYYHTDSIGSDRSLMSDVLSQSMGAVVCLKPHRPYRRPPQARCPAFCLACGPPGMSQYNLRPWTSKALFNYYVPFVFYVPLFRFCSFDLSVSFPLHSSALQCMPSFLSQRGEPKT